MLERADRPIEDVVRALAEKGLEAGFLVPTETGLDHFIMDAHGQLRDYLRRAGFHDFDAQLQGPESKVLVKAWLLTSGERKETQASLYRPRSKGGDPRIWVSGIKAHAKAGNVLALFAHDGALHVANMSAPGVLESLHDSTSPLGNLAREIAIQDQAPAVELLEKLRGVASMGYVESLRPGPTGVGMTLETLLGIPANSSKSPDFKGIEIKASRSLGASRKGGRITLFSKVPDWDRSAIGDAVSLLQRYGYDVDGRRQLYCSMTNEPNTLGLYLSPTGVDLHAMHADGNASARVVQWGMGELKKALAEKHQQTFWVKARVKRDAGGVEKFHYVEVVHTRAPVISNLDSLLETGHVEVDFLLHLMERSAGQKPRARDHGYLFKMKPTSLGLLFPPSVRHVLT